MAALGHDYGVCQNLACRNLLVQAADGVDQLRRPGDAVVSTVRRPGRSSGRGRDGELTGGGGDQVF